LGITGPPLRATGYDWDLRKKQPYCGYETYDFEVQTWDTMDAYGRFRIRLNEMWESLKIIEQCVERLEKMRGAPIAVADKKIAWPAQLSIGSDGMGNSNEYLKHIMGRSMGADRHFKLVTEGWCRRARPTCAIESPRGEAYATWYRRRDAPFVLHTSGSELHQPQAMPVMCEGAWSPRRCGCGCVGSVMSGVDR
jgi:NADH-quinone oxidoreductase subunit D